MAIIIFTFRPVLNRCFRPFFKGRSLLCIAALVSYCAAPGHAGLIPSAKDRAQADAVYQQAYASYQTGDYPDAQRLLDQAEKLKPDQADGWNLRGVIYLKQKAFDKAEAAFTRAIAIDPDLWAAQFNRAEVPFQKKDYPRSRTLFERLLSQTDRFKATSKWELVLYKAYISALLMGDEADARKKLAKFPTAGSTSPALVYAQAALAYSHKDAAGARRTLGTVQTTYPPAINELFSSSLENAGWQAPQPPVYAAAPLPPLMGQGAVAMNPSGVAASSLYLPPLPPGTITVADRQAIVIDPKVETAAAEPLPVPDAGSQPVTAQMIVPHSLPNGTMSGSHNAGADASPNGGSATQTKPLVSPASPLSDAALERGGLLLQ